MCLSQYMRPHHEPGHAPMPCTHTLHPHHAHTLHPHGHILHSHSHPAPARTPGPVCCPHAHPEPTPEQGLHPAPTACVSRPPHTHLCCTHSLCSVLHPHSACTHAGSRTALSGSPASSHHWRPPGSEQRTLRPVWGPWLLCCPDRTHCSTPGGGVPPEPPAQAPWGHTHAVPSPLPGLPGGHVAGALEPGTTGWPEGAPAPCCPPLAPALLQDQGLRPGHLDWRFWEVWSPGQRDRGCSISDAGVLGGQSPRPASGHIRPPQVCSLACPCCGLEEEGPEWVCRAAGQGRAQRAGTRLPCGTGTSGTPPPPEATGPGHPGRLGGAFPAPVGGAEPLA
nr:uncharacterized protein LOC127492635 [Oryctolagus cuniculus]